MLRPTPGEEDSFLPKNGPFGLGIDVGTVGIARLRGVLVLSCLVSALIRRFLSNTNSGAVFFRRSVLK